MSANVGTIQQGRTSTTPWLGIALALLLVASVGVILSNVTVTDTTDTVGPSVVASRMESAAAGERVRFGRSSVAITEVGVADEDLTAEIGLKAQVAQRFVESQGASTTSYFDVARLAAADRNGI
jgi:hypothetical protein